MRVNKDNLLIEIFTEELPPDSTENLGIHLGKNISEELLSRKLIDEIKFQSFATPRRLAVHIHSVSGEAKDERKLIKNRHKKINNLEKNIFIQNLNKIGYPRSSKIKKYKYSKILTKAFQRRFRQELINGVIDQECLIISKKLINI